MGDTWGSNRGNIAHGPDRIRLVTLETDAGTVVQRPRLDDKQQSIVAALGRPEPPRYYDFQPRTH